MYQDNPNLKEEKKKKTIPFFQNKKRKKLDKDY